MAKKRFKEGLESLFGEPEPKPLSLFPEEEKVTVEVRSRKNKKEDTSGSQKRFANKLDAFLAEAFEEVEAEEKKSKTKKTSPTAPPRRRSGSGLDILIRNTSVPREKEARPEPNTKRLTVVIEKEKLEKLKEIARRKDAYLKDIIGDLVAAYIKETT